MCLFGWGRRDQPSGDTNNYYEYHYGTTEETPTAGDTTGGTESSGDDLKIDSGSATDSGSSSSGSDELKIDSDINTEGSSNLNY